MFVCNNCVRHAFALSYPPTFSNLAQPSPAQSSLLEKFVFSGFFCSLSKAERSLNMYSVLPYFLSKMIAELPLTALFPSISGVVMYKMCGLHPKRDR